MDKIIIITGGRTRNWSRHIASRGKKWFSLSASIDLKNATAANSVVEQIRHAGGKDFR